MTAAGNITLTLLVDSEGWRWRLVAGNHRGIAIAPGHHPTSDAASEAVRQVLELVRADELSTQFVHPESALSWRWTAVDGDGAPVATGERVYGRYGTCVAAYRRFLCSLLAWSEAGEPSSLT